MITPHRLVMAMKNGVLVVFCKKCHLTEAEIRGEK